MSNFVTYNSSAGSGKTYTLVKEYLKIALESDNERAYKSILAVTFTNKAAAEMKERIIDALKSLSGLTILEGTPKFLLADLIKPKSEGGIAVDEKKIHERSIRVLRSILHNYNDFGISTIDKFTHKIIRTFAHDLQLPLNFEIEIDEMDVLSKAIDLLIMDVGVNEKLTKLLVEYTKKKADEEQSWHIEQELFKFSKNLLKDEGELNLQKIRNLSIADFDSIKKELNNKTQKFEKQVMSLAEEALQFIEGKGIDPTSFSRSFFTNYWRDLLLLKKLDPTATTLKIIAGDQNWYAATVDVVQKTLIDNNRLELEQLFKASRDFIDSFKGQYFVDKLLIKNLYNLAVINEIEKTILTFKKENNVLNISDFNKRISKIVASEPIPFIYERVGEKYNHFLIDEFQDTSIVQWHNLIPLIDNSLGTGHFSMVVGDAKQAIYRFRGGEVEQIIQLPQIYKNDGNLLLLEREQSLTRNYKRELLNTNYRSKAEIVKFNNQFFQSVAQNLSEKYRSIYDNLEQTYNSENNGGGVHVQFLEAENKEVLTERNLVRTVEIIDQSVVDNYKLSDIAVLTRSNADGISVARYLVENGINVISSESLLLNTSKEVLYLLAVLKYITYPSDKNYQLQVLNYLITNKYTSDHLFDVFSKYPEKTLFNYLNEKGIGIDEQYISNLSLYELCEFIIKQFKLDKAANVYVQFFLDKVYEYTIRNDNSILNFLEWWEAHNHKFSIVVPDGVDAVKVMSIHKSKGLEFPVVIYPFAVSDVKLGEQFFWTSSTNVEGLKSAILPINKTLIDTNFAVTYQDEVDKSILDLINVMYVAFTRSKERLYLLSQIKYKAGKISKSKNGSVSDYLINFCEGKHEHKIDENNFVFGKFIPKSKAVEKNIKDEVFSNVVYNNWREKIRISYQAPQVWEIENPQVIGAYGTLIHKVLSEINELEDLDGVLDNFLLKGIINEEELGSIKDDLVAIFEVEKIRYLFTSIDEIKNESTILTPSGESYQPDRVIVKDNKTIVVDYKTGEEQSTHIKQIENYRLRLFEMGYKNLECYILYIKSVKLIQV